MGGFCTHPAKECDDGEACDGVETCDPATGCVAGTPMDCDDGNECTDDDCQNSECVYTNLPPWTTCTDDGNPCTWDHCLDGVCVASPHDDCDLCEGSSTDVCLNGSCVAPTCNLGSASASGCPGGTVRADLPFGCWPGCFGTFMVVNPSLPDLPPGWSATLAGSPYCTSSQPMPIKGFSLKPVARQRRLGFAA